jgi:DNA modification methylase
VLKGSESHLGNADIFQGDARSMELGHQSVDGILFSPPYSFAINYLANDSFHLNFMGENIDQLKEKMVGLRGRTVKDKYKLYIEDMDKVLSECARVLKPACFCTIIVGTNDNQLSKALDIPKEQVTGLHKILIDFASKHGLKLVRSLPRQISGMANTMRTEYIVILQRN